MAYMPGRDGVGRASFSQLKAPDAKEYQTQSCGCLERLNGRRIIGAYAASLTATQIRDFFEGYAEHGSYYMAKRLGITKYQAVVTWFTHCKFLQAKPRRLRKSIYDACQLSPEAAAKRTGMTKYEVLRIQWHWKKDLEREQQNRDAHALHQSFKIAEGKSQFRIYAVFPPWTGSIDTDVVEYMEMAIDDVAKYEEDQWPQERRPNELTRYEFKDGKGRSEYGWVYLTLRSMASNEVDRCFGETGRRFMEICRVTLENRLQRKRDYNSGQKSPGSKIGRSKKRMPKSRFLPSPTQKPYQIASILRKYSASLADARQVL